MDINELLNAIVDAIGPSEAEALPAKKPIAAIAAKIPNIIEERASRLLPALPMYTQKDLGKAVEYALLGHSQKPLDFFLHPKYPPEEWTSLFKAKPVNLNDILAQVPTSRAFSIFNYVDDVADVPQELREQLYAAEREMATSPRFAGDVLAQTRNLGANKATLRHEYQINNALFKAYQQGGMPAAQAVAEKKLQAAKAARLEELRRLGEPPAVIRRADKDITEEMPFWIDDMLTPLQRRIDRGEPVIQSLRRIETRGVDLRPVIKTLEEKYANEAPRLWQELQPEMQHNLRQSFDRFLNRMNFIQDPDDVVNTTVGSLIMGNDPRTRNPIPGSVLRGFQSPRLSTLIGGAVPNEDYSAIPSIYRYLRSLPTREITPMGRISVRGTSPAAETLRELRSNALSKQMNPPSSHEEGVRQAIEQFDKWSQVQEPHTEFGDAIQRILRELPADQTADWKTIKKTYPSEANRFGPEFYAVLSKSGGDLRKATNNIFEKFSKVKGNPNIRTTWVSRPANYENPWAIREQALTPNQENLLVVGDPKLIYGLAENSPRVASQYAHAVNVHAPMVGDAKLLPPVGWVEINKFKIKDKEHWLVTEMQSDLLSKVQHRLPDLRKRVKVMNFVNDLLERNPPPASRNRVGAPSPSNFPQDEVREFAKQFGEDMGEVFEQVATYWAYGDKLSATEIANNLKELNYLDDLQSRFKDWYNHGLSEVMARARKEKVENVHILTPEMVSQMGLEGEAKLKTFYEDVPRKFRFTRGRASEKKIPIERANYGTKKPAEVWSRIPAVIPPGILLGDLLGEEFPTQ